jgi:hypothetical protein
LTSQKARPIYRASPRAVTESIQLEILKELPAPGRVKRCVVSGSTSSLHIAELHPDGSYSCTCQKNQSSRNQARKTHRGHRRYEEYGMCPHVVKLVKTYIGADNLQIYV